MDSQHARKPDERRLEFLIHERLFFSDVLNANDPEPETYPWGYLDHLVIHREMFKDWRGDLDEIIRKKRFGGKEETTQAEIDAWRNWMRTRYEVSEALLWKNHFSDRDEATVNEDEIDEVRWKLDAERREVEREERRAAKKKAEEIAYRRSRGLPDEPPVVTWPEAFADVLCFLPTSIGWPLISYQLLYILERSARTEKDTWIFLGSIFLILVILFLFCFWIRGQILKLYLSYRDSVTITHDSDVEEKMVLLGEEENVPFKEDNRGKIGSSKSSTRRFLYMRPENIRSNAIGLHALITLILIAILVSHIVIVENLAIW